MNIDLISREKYIMDGSAYDHSFKIISLLILALIPFQCALSDTSLEAYTQSVTEQCLALDLPPTHTITNEKARIIADEAFQKVTEADYASAIQIVLIGLAEFPHDFLLQSRLASIVGDYAESLTEPLKSIVIQWWKALFNKLLQEIDGQPKRAAYSLKNEYYYRFGLYQEQYENGIMRVQEFWQTPEWESALGYYGFYGQGVGAANYARVLVEKGDISQAYEYAHKALIAWEQFFSYNHDYYNAYVHYALALGILGQQEKMMQALETSAALIKRDLEYSEFQEVIDWVAAHEDLLRAS